MYAFNYSHSNYKKIVRETGFLILEWVTSQKEYNQNGGWKWDGNLYNINKIQYLLAVWRRVPTANGDYLIYFHPLTIVSNLFMRTYPLMFIGRVYNSMRNGTYPLMFIGRVYNSMRNRTYPLMFICRVYNSMRNRTYPLMFIGRVYNSMRNGT